jgi:small-conductance mechanosensitive channel
MILAYYLNKILQQAIKKFGEVNKLEIQLINAIRILSKIFIYSISITLCLENLHVHLSALFGTLGVVAIGIGFALQNALANMTSGIFLLYYKPFFIGDYIYFESVESDQITEGKVIDINLRLTTLEYKDTIILVPNHTVYSAVITVRKSKK